MAASIIERFRKERKRKKMLSEEQRTKVREQIVHGEFVTSQQKEYYKNQAETAILKAQKALACNDIEGRRIAMNELKVAYGVYKYMSSLHDSFRVLESQVQMQMLTEEFSQVVNELSRIRVSAVPVNFASLTKKALGNFPPIDTKGLDSMVNSLMSESIAATESQYADDSFLEKLVSGTVSLDDPYPSKALDEIRPKESDTDAGIDENIIKLLNRLADNLSDD